ncbi:MAG TPA: PQQ-dependent sugar dehydrogenase [Ktedonobacteraceae bacterium]|nr:PQQ-dependent sugar dehydrogenase [Ktedonobacteraceae bacterium]
MQDTIDEEKKDTANKPPRHMKRWQIVVLVVLVILGLAAGVLFSQRETLSSLLIGSHFTDGKAGVTTLHLPAGFHADVFYTDKPGVRFITFGPDGTLFITERAQGNIVALPDPQHTGKATQKIVVASGLNDPTSLYFYQGALYVGEASQVSRFALGPDLKATGKQVIVPHLPTGGNHTTRTVLIGPDGHLYVSIGSTCNVCIETDPQRATVWVYNIDGSNGHLYAKGLRNAVGMAINPWNKQIWVTNNGRDLLGDDIPPETVYALQNGGDYGWPRCHAGDIIDPDYGHPGDCNGIIKPLVKMQAHSAPLGLAFYNFQGAAQFPQQYHGLYVAFHGSWNRSIPTGYKVVFIPLDNKGQVTGPLQDFATGWQVNNNTVTGRPVGLAIGPDGALYISEDAGGVIYRVTYSGK